MERILKLVLVFALCLSFAFALVACDSKGEEEETGNSSDTSAPEGGDESQDEEIFIDYSSCEVVNN